MSTRSFNVYDILNEKNYVVSSVEELANLVGMFVKDIPLCRIGGMVVHDNTNGVFGPERWRVIEESHPTPEEQQQALKEASKAYWSTPNTSPAIKRLFENLEDEKGNS